MQVRSLVQRMIEQKQAETDGADQNRARIPCVVWSTTGCVIAPTLFNVFIDHIVKKALDMMPEGAGVSVVTRVSALQQGAQQGVSGVCCSTPRACALVNFWSNHRTVSERLSRIAF
jgi:hypothetical protein